MQKLNRIHVWKKQDGLRVSKTKSTTVPVLMLFRDNELFCRRALPKLMMCVSRALSRSHLESRFYFYENNSKDDTAELLRRVERQWPSKVVLCTENHPARLLSHGASRSTERCTGMARLRNAIRAMATPDLEHARVALLIDTNLWFSSRTIELLVHQVLSGKLNMALPMSLCALKHCHYYDTYALTWQDEQPTASVRRRTCPLKECTACKEGTIPVATKSTIPVQSAFGGVAAVHPTTLLNHDWSSSNDACEHVAFCQGIKKIGIVPKARARWLQMIHRYAGVLANKLDSMYIQ